MPRYRFLETLGKIYLVVAWLGIAGGLVTLLMADISDKPARYGVDGAILLESGTKGIGFGGVMWIVAVTALHFIVFMGLSQLVRLLLSLDESVGNVGRRLAEVSVSLGEVRAAQTKTAEHVRMVGEIVYDEAKK